MFISNLKLEVLDALRPAPLDSQQVAATLPLAPWYARETLRTLKRDGLVIDTWGQGRVTWALTRKAWRELHERDQLPLEVTS